MNKKFTKLIAALALLVFMTPTMAGWGQTRTEKVSSLVFTAACGGSGTANDGVEWTVTSDGTESSFDNTKGIHYGTSSAQVQYIMLTTSQISGTITKVVVNASTASGVTATVDVTVGGSAFGGDPQSTSTTATEYTFNGSASGEIVVTHTKPSSATKALYVKSVVVTYTTDGGGGTGGGTGGGGNSGSTQTLTFPFTSNITGWPTTNSTTLTNYTYTLDNVAYTFALNNVKCNTSYLMCTYTAVLGLPAIEGYKLTKVVASNSSGCSTATKVGISSSSSSASYISGGAIQTWSTTSSSYTYNLSSTEANTMYYLYVTNKNAQVVGLELTYEYVTPPAVATPTFSLDGGYYVGTKNVTISCETADATIYYTTDGTTPSASNGTQGTSVSISTTTTLKAIAIKGDDSSSVAEATYTILTPLTTMQQIFDAATNTETTVAVTFDNYVITGKTTTQAYMTDGTKGCMLFGSGHGFNAGDVLSGTVICKLVLYYGKPEFKELTSSTTGISVATGGTVTPVATTIDAVGLINAGSVVTFSNLTYDGSKLSDGTNTIEPYNGVGYSPSFTSGRTYNVTGVFGYGYGSTDDYKRIFPRSASDITEVVASTPTIYANTASLTGFTYAEGNGPSEAQTISVSGTNLEGNITIALNNGTNFEISLSSGSGYDNSLTLTPTGGTVEATTVYVRMKSGLPIANDYADQINLTSTNATAVAVSLAGTVTGPEVTWDLSAASYDAGATANLVTWSSNYVTMTNAKGTSTTGANNYLGGGSNNHTRFYQNNVLTFTPASGYAISSIEITAVSSYVAGFTGNNWTNATTSTSSTLVTVTPTNGNNACSVVISAACRATSVTVYYETSTLTPHDIAFDVDNGTVVATPSTAVAGATVTLKIYPAAGYYLATNSDIIVVDEDTDDVDLTNVNAGTFTFIMPDKDVTVYASFTAYTGTYYTLVDDAADLIPGRHYIIANSKEAGDAYVMAAQGSGYREAVAATVVGNIIYETTNVREIVLSGDNTNFWTLYDDGTGAASQGYLYAATGNKLNRRTDNSEDNNGKWAISINNEGVATIVSQIEGTDVSNTIKFNNSTSPKRFSCYTPTSGQQSVYLYIKGGESNYELYSNTTCSSLTIGELDIYTVHSPAVLNVTGTLTNSGDHENLIIEDGGQLICNNAVNATVQKNIIARSTENEVNKGWAFIASPIATSVAPTSVSNMTDTNFDLYRFNQNADLEWENYLVHNSTNDPFLLVNGQGYLYNNVSTKTLEFAGAIKPSNTSVIVPLDYVDGAEFDGWNLVGNPFTFKAYVNKSYYKMNEAGSAILADEQDSGATIPPCTGIMVYVDQTGQSITFSKERIVNTPSNGNVSIAVAQANERGTSTITIDNAIVSFNEGNELPKFYFGNQDANLYIPQDNKEYAIAVSEGQGEMPVNFRANENGTYTLTVNPEGVEVNYLHLIDNMTGNDIDLLMNPSYSFNATTNDYESRFRLVFASNGASTGSASDAAFAFMSDGNWIINNAGEATLQVIDLNGRILSSERVNGSVSKTVNATPGVYMLRLINGDNVKVQKIVVR